MAVSVVDSWKRQLLFEVGIHLFAADAGQVREVLEPMPATPIPGAPPAVLGLINIRGTLLVAAELAALLELPSAEEEEAALVVLAYGERRLALQIDRLVGVAPYTSDGPDVGSELLKALGAGDLVTGVGEFRTRPYYHLSVGAIFDRVLGDESERSLQQVATGGRGGK